MVSSLSCFSFRSRFLIAFFSVLVLSFSSFASSVFAAGTGQSPTLLSPVPGSSLAGSSATFTWSDEGATSYDIAIGSALASPNYFWKGATTVRSVTVSNLPTNGSTIYVRLFSHFAGMIDPPARDFTVKAYQASSTTPTPVVPQPTNNPAKLLSPVAGSTLTSDMVVLQWSNENAVSYVVRLGNKYGATTYGYQSGLKTPTATFTKLPTNGVTLYGRITTKFKLQSVNTDFTLKAFTYVAPVPTPTPTPTPVPSVGSLTGVWANDGGDKVTRDEQRATKNAAAVVNSVWNGSQVSLFGAKNEVVQFNTILEAGTVAAKNVSVQFNTLIGPGGAKIASVPTSGNGVFNWTNRDIELFYMRYLQIKGLSRLSYETYDERHIPARLRRAFTGAGIGSGGWVDRPDHDKFYPEIAVPLELKPSFDIAAGQNQSIWVDIYIPKDAAVGLYQGTLSILENGSVTRTLPVSLTVKNFTLSDAPASKTMVVFDHRNVNHRFLGVDWPNAGTPEAVAAKNIRDELYQVAHRNRISLIHDDEISGDAPTAEEIPRLDGSLFTAANGYRGPGEGVGNGVYAVGLYGSWNWQSQDEAAMRTHTNNWTSWFDTHAPQTDYFLYLADESSNYPQLQKWATWMAQNPGVGKKMLSFATASLPDAVAAVPALNIVASWVTVGDSATWQNAYSTLMARNPANKFYAYNGKRPSNGSFATEDDGVALRELAWAQFKKGIDRWFFWQSTYYNDYQGGRGETNVFQNAATFSGAVNQDSVLGETGWNHSNGDGVLFYPGTDKQFPADSYGVSGPFASLRLKMWRRGIQDVDYIQLAMKKDPVATQAIVNRLVPKALWDYGIADPSDPTWVRTDISWSTNSDDWEAARAQLAAIIAS